MGFLKLLVRHAGLPGLILAAISLVLEVLVTNSDEK